MQNNQGQKLVNKKVPIDIPVYTINKEARKLALQRYLFANPKAVIKAGTHLTNPYKDTYDLARAEQRVYLEKLQNSKLWSPKYTPMHFKYLFLVPMLFGIGFSIYIHKINMPRRMVMLKEKLGVRFKNNEGMLRNDGWIQREYYDDIYGDIFQQKEEDEVQIRSKIFINEVSNIFN